MAPIEFLALLLRRSSTKKTIATIVERVGRANRVVCVPCTSSCAGQQRRPLLHTLERPLPIRAYELWKLKFFWTRALQCFIRWPIFVHLRRFLFAFIQKALFLVDIPLWSSPFVTVIAYSLSTSFYIIRGTSPAICLCT